MTALYVTSLSGMAGKTMLCAGLGKNWLNTGKKIGYLRLLASAEKDKAVDAERDAAFIRRMFSLTESPDTLISTLSGLKGAYANLAQDKDTVIIEGLPLNASGNAIEDLGAMVLVVHEYSAQLSAALPEYKKLGKRLLGVILNKVPRSKMGYAQSQSAGQLAQAGVPFLGIIPEDRLLLTLTVAELADLLGGKILNNADSSGELIENFMLGALAADSGEEYYNRKNNKAVILKSERPDMQMAALQTSLRCMVISGPVSPVPVVVQQAKARKVPLIIAGGDVMSLITTLEQAAGRIKFNQDKKLPLLMDILRQNLNLKLLDQGLGLAA